MKMKTLMLAVIAVTAIATACDCGGNPTPINDQDGGEQGTGGGGGNGQDSGTGGGSGGGAGGGSGGGGGANLCAVNPCGLCPSGSTDTSSCDTSTGVWSCTCAFPDGGVVDGGQVVSDGGIDFNTICTDLARRQCDYFVRCNADSAGGADFRLNVPSVAQSGTNPSRGDNIQIAASEKDTCLRWLANDIGCSVLTAGADAGRVTTSRQAYLDCFAQNYPANTCDKDFAQLINKCLPFGDPPYLQGLVASGGQCFIDAECANGYCTSNPGAGMCGMCQPYLGTTGGAQNCAREEQCDPATSYCPNAGGQRCRVYVQDGGQCGAAGGNNNPYTEACAPGLVCSGPQNQNRACRPGKPLGASCVENNFECARSGAEIVRGIVFPETLCDGLPDGGGLCVNFNAPRNGSCGTGEPILVPFAPFLLAGPFCPDTQYCNANLCTDRRSATQPCTADDQCQLGLRCVNQFCTAYLDVGVQCNNSDECKSLLSCQGNAQTTCQPQYGNVGEPCNNTTNPPGRCVPTESYCPPGGNQTCQDKLSNGAACANNVQCESGDCQTTCQAACWQ